MSETQKIGVFIDWHIPSRSTTGPDFAPVDYWAGRLHEVCDSAIETALKTGAAHIEIKVLSKEIQLSRQFVKGERSMLAREIAERIAKDVAELSDRTSPDDWPEAMLVTAEELIQICERNIAEAQGHPK